jgi:Tfp pilus assembly protein PilO
MVLGIAVAGIVSSVTLKMQRLRLEEARLRAGDPADRDELAHQLTVLQQEMIEVQERLDFAERLLAQARERPALPAAQPPHGPS